MNPTSSSSSSFATTTTEQEKTTREHFWLISTTPFSNVLKTRQIKLIFMSTTTGGGDDAPRPSSVSYMTMVDPRVPTFSSLLQQLGEVDFDFDEKIGDGGDDEGDHPERGQISVDPLFSTNRWCASGVRGFLDTANIMFADMHHWEPFRNHLKRALIHHYLSGGVAREIPEGDKLLTIAIYLEGRYKRMSLAKGGESAGITRRRQQKTIDIHNALLGLASEVSGPQVKSDAWPEVLGIYNVLYAHEEMVDLLLKQEEADKHQGTLYLSTIFGWVRDMNNSKIFMNLLDHLRRYFLVFHGHLTKDDLNQYGWMLFWRQVRYLVAVWGAMERVIDLDHHDNDQNIKVFEDIWAEVVKQMQTGFDDLMDQHVQLCDTNLVVAAIYMAEPERLLLIPEEYEHEQEHVHPHVDEKEEVENEEEVTLTSMNIHDEEEIKEMEQS